MRFPMRKTTLPVNAELEAPEADVAFGKMRRHDGTHLATYETISDLTQAAEQYAAREGGEWEISPVYVQTTFTYRDGVVVAHGGPPRPGMAPKYQQDLAVTYLKRIAQVAPALRHQAHS